MSEAVGEDRVYQIFQRIAGQYDRANRVISLGLQDSWKRMLIRGLAETVPEGGTVLDVCCGTGDISLGIAKLRRDVLVTGLDFSPEMLKRAEQRREGLENLSYFQGNALALPFAEGSFDAAAISFGLRNTPDYGGTLGELCRVVRDGGRVWCLDSLVPDSRLVRPFYRLYFRYVMPLLGGGTAYSAEYRWLYESTESFLRRGELLALFRQKGLASVEAKSRMFGACVLCWGVKKI